MEGNSIFSSSTNSSTSSPTNTNFPFSLNQASTLDHHDYHDHHGSLMMMMMMGDDHQQVQIIQPPLNTVHESNDHLMMNTYHDHHHGNDNDHQNKSIFMDNNNKNDSKLIKKGSTVGKKGKKHRYAFQTRSQVDILDDGYRWRKYGQKAVKNSKFPRSYYRCTYQGCNVKKQVQRLSNDEGVVVTTYEGSHSHSIERSTDNFEHILSQMQIYTS